jgi:hypothetical protein
MKIVVFTQAPLKREVAQGSVVFPWTDLMKTRLEDYTVVFLVGSPMLDEETKLTNAEAAALWHYVRQGGKLYSELISSFDFPSSRLLGLKQDFRKSRRTLEKLRTTAAAELACPEGSILEWEGALIHGFAVQSELLLEFGAFKETHVSAGSGDKETKGYPALGIRKLGEGLVVNASFALFSCEETAALRPYKRWAELIEALTERTGIPFTMWQPAMQISVGKSPEAVVAKSADWFIRSGMLPRIDGKNGVLENIHSVTGALSSDRRPDCHAHTALMFYLYGRSSGKQEWTEASHGLMQSLFDDGFQDMDPSSASYGFFKWYDFPEETPDQIFTDDNAWVGMVLLYLYRKTGVEEYRRRGLLVAEAMLSTQHASGLRSNVVTGAQLREMGQARIAAELTPSMNPHFESIAHTAFIQAYLVTGDKAYLDTAIKGSIHMLERLDELEFMYSRTSVYGRFILPLTYLFKYDDSGTIRKGLEQVVDYLLAWQHASGGIEEADNPDPERFGQEDAGVYIHNGEGIADQLYTNNFLLMNAWEAWKATGEAKFEKLYESLRDYLCHIQISSDDPRFNGGWMRAYDFELGEYFGNNGDTGWGPYCLESGWTNAMIPTGMLLGLLDESIFE